MAHSCHPSSPGTEKLKQEDFEIENSPNNLVRPCIKISQDKPEKELEMYLKDS